MAKRGTKKKTKGKGSTDADESSPKGIVRRKGDRMVDRFSVYLPVTLGYDLRVQAVRERRQISEIIADAVKEYLERHGD